MEYLDFDVKVESSGGEDYRVVVIRSPAGETSARSRIPQRLGELSDGIRLLVESQSAGRARHVMPAERIATSVPLLRSLEEYGCGLFETLLPSEVLACYRVSLAKAREQGKGLRLRLRFESASLAAVPWEYVFDPSVGDHVSLSRETSIVRYLEMERSPQKLTTKPPLRVLGLISSPSDLEELAVKREAAQLERSIEHLTENGSVKIEWLEGATWRDLQHAMRRGPWHVFHFIGHSGVAEDGRGGVIAMCDDNGRAFYLAGEDLGRLLSGHASMRLAVLNSCESGRTSGTNVFASPGAELIRRGVPAVVSMQFVITDRAALEFSRSFYEALVDGMPVDAAVSDARRSIKIALGQTSEWGTPVVHMHALDGPLFDIDVASAVFPDGDRSSATDAPAPTGMTNAPRAERAAPEEGLRRGLLILAQKVRRFWVEGVLNQSLFQAALIELGMDHMEGAVASPWTSVMAESDRSSRPLPAGKTLGDVFAEEGGSFLILGEPGSGKTTAMLGLLRGLLDQAETDATDPIPVVLNLSSWAPGQTLDGWIVDELSTKYQAPRRIGSVWLAASRLLPLLDGLDEVPAGVRPACVTAINDFVQSGASMGTIVCCRTKEYVALPNRLTLNTAVLLRDLTRDQVLGWVRVSGPPLEALYEGLQRDSDLLLQARSPLMLSLMARTYRDVSIDALAHEDGESAKTRRTKLMEAYVARMFRRAAGADRG